MIMLRESDIMKQKGFTLVELLAVIVILGAIATVATVSVFSIIEAQKEELLKEQISNLKDSLQSYYVQSKRYLSVCTSSDPATMMNDASLSCGIVVSIGDLVNQGYFENKNQICNETKKVLIYRASQTDTRVYVPDDACGQ